MNYGNIGSFSDNNRLCEWRTAGMDFYQVGKEMVGEFVNNNHILYNNGCISLVGVQPLLL